MHPYLLQLLSAEHRRQLQADAEIRRLVSPHRRRGRQQKKWGLFTAPRLPVAPVLVRG